ncbi:hypothetical protein RJ639_007980 [Escallonia herrerae]|uniref:Protein kinase domain-containing protein n=1 Tax=Escallonia herrerae TaxID=1293975 RepID=A0AA88VS55_9ASTE|nr:hypothetical protein RJ639_007980 [Escallonia herrerae]
MGCFFSSGDSTKKSKKKVNKQDDQAKPTSDRLKVSPDNDSKKNETKNANQSLAADGLVSTDAETAEIKAHSFTFSEMVAATENFKSDYFLGEGGFGKVYKGKLENSGEIVAIKQLDRNGLQGIREFIVEVLTLSLADHPNLVKLIGYCAEGDQKLLVYEFMPLGSLEDHLHGSWSNRKQLDWITRMKIATGAAMGLEHLHDQMKPPVIYRDLKCSNILLGEGYHPKLSDFGLAKVGPQGDKTHARPLFKDRRKFYQMADPALQGQYPARGLYQALAIAAMCVQEQPNMRPLIADVVIALNYLATQPFDPQIHSRRASNRSSRRNDDEQKQNIDDDETA